MNLGHVLELSLPIGIPFLMMGCTSAVPGVLRMTAEITVIYQHPSTKWINATRHKNDRIPVAQVNKLNIDQQCGVLWHVSSWDVLLDISCLCHKMLLFISVKTAKVYVWLCLQF